MIPRPIVHEYFQRLGVIGIFALSVFFICFSKIFLVTDSRPNSLMIAPSKSLSKMTFGFDQAMSGLLWLKFLQNSDYCESVEKKSFIGGPKCPWQVQTLDLITDLSPKARIYFAIGTLILSVVVSDVSGADFLFDKAVVSFPNDWPILYRAAYHALMESNDKSKAMKYLVRAGNSGAPPWVYSLAGRIAVENGEIEMAESLLFQLKREGQKKEIIERLEQKIAAKRKMSTSNRLPAVSN